MKLFPALKMAAAAMSIALLAGCAVTPVIPPRGVFYTNQTAPLFNAEETGPLKGSASAHNILFLFGWGDCSIRAAMEDGQIKRIKNIDYNLMNIFIFYQQFTVTVYGDKGSAAPEQPPAKK